MNHESLGKNKEGIMNNEGQMISLPPPSQNLSAVKIFNFWSASHVYCTSWET